jgi:hypothetical protein
MQEAAKENEWYSWYVQHGGAGHHLNQLRVCDPLEVGTRTEEAKLRQHQGLNLVGDTGPAAGVRCVLLPWAAKPKLKQLPRCIVSERPSCWQREPLSLLRTQKNEHSAAEHCLFLNLCLFLNHQHLQLLLLASHLAAELAEVLGVLADLHLLDLLTETRSIASSVLAHDANLLGALRLQQQQHQQYQQGSSQGCTKGS